MTREEILNRVKEIEARARMPEYQDLRSWAATLAIQDVPELCQVVRQLVARLEKVEAVAEAAQEVVRGSLVETLYANRWERRYIWGPQWDRLEKALAALEEGSDE